MVDPYLVFLLDDRRHALHLSVVDRVVHMVYVTPLPGAPDIVLGVVDMRGRLMPVVDVRKRFGLPGRRPAPADQLIVARMKQEPVALAVNDTLGIVECADQERIPVSGILPGVPYCNGVIRTRDGLILIHDLDAFLSLTEAAALDRALDAAGR
ncbi:chemotaxis protein CheW [Nitrosovibrio sp. Nv17]|jgi:purine-binding chemotaxis protein CheW|uniref:chemotaxis protein CheW n=1 Tax=Nitrosovibrio sp. Nv17 TaxID=1855339 RepID=UPI000908CD7D|nr:chemotaxis protein CheW [Nitrosovibrio sp. Nv17]SFW30462.1 CheW protein [Nitrosovibrio sp. Nv17]